MPTGDPADLLIRSEAGRLLPHLDARALCGKRLFVTGGTGFFGYWILAVLRALGELGCELRVTVLSRSPERFIHANPELRGCSDWLRLVQGDVRTLAAPDQPYDWVIHGATDSSADAQGRSLELYDILVGGTKRVLEHASQAGARRVLLLSSGAVYGPAATRAGAIPEDCPFGPSPMDSHQAYGEGKRAMEMAGALYAAAGLLEVVSARCFAFVGPRLPLDGHFAIGNFISDAQTRDRIEVKGTGTPVRSYLYIGDAVLWLLALLARGRSGEAYNVGSDEPHSIRDLARLTAEVLAPHKPVVTGGRAGDDNQRSYYVPRTDRAQALGLRAWTDLRQAIALTARYHALHSQRTGVP